ncbi:hypothetical protein ABDK00_006245 [Niabella insulamsoli]|uniref:hypothetical protein n=1 Tax=Niabella insulamsoli TaxID=3144874 RepID=UPI0031FDA603
MQKIADGPFAKLLGTWTTTGKIYHEDKILELRGTDTYRLIVDGNYILHEACVLMGPDKSETFEVIYPAGAQQKAQMHYFNSEAANGIMSAEITSHNFAIDGAGIKFRGRFSIDYSTISGKWEVQAADNNWTLFIDILLEKQG